VTVVMRDCHPGSFAPHATAGDGTGLSG